jgi:signal transduction histidine kinase
VRKSATGRKGDAIRRAPDAARAGRGRLGKKIAQLRRTPSGTPLRLKNWSLKTKLVAVLLIPTLTALVLIGLHFNSQLSSANRLSELSARVSTDRALAGLVHALQRERDLTVHFVAAGRSTTEPEFTQQRSRVNARLGDFSKAYAAAKPELSDDAVRDLDGVRSQVAGLTRLRYGAQHDKYPPEKVQQSYTDLIAELLAVRGQSVAAINEPELVRLQLAGTALARVKEQMSVTRALVDEALVTGDLPRDRKRDLVAATQDIEAWGAEFETFASAEQQRMHNDTVTGMLVDKRNEILVGVMSRSDNNRSFGGLDQAQWDAAATYTVNLVREVESALLAEMQDRTDALGAQARTSALRDGAIVLTLLLLAGLFALVIGRSLIRPLRTLRSTALEVAEYRLPAAVHGLLANPKGPRKTDVAPVPVTSTEEVGQVARAFDAVHGEAVRLAAEQAELRQNVNTMFLNLARRGQELADRQLDVLDAMEAGEQDPDALAKLFELDHLATRSRRICENLLVLTGNDYARMLPGSVPASEVIAAALSEIEHYQRVQLTTIPEIAVRGDSVSDVVHVISELLENATNESGADKPVSVVSSMNREGNWLVEITDSGEGMSDEEMDTANARLADPPEIDVEASRRMGLYVIARLARRNGLEVRLRHASTGGLTASVLVPAKLIGEASAGPGRVDPAGRPDWLETASKRQAARAARTPQPAGPPKRAPIVKRSEPVMAAAADDGHPLEDDVPTERMPMYRDLLTKWFEPGGPQPAPQSGRQESVEEPQRPEPVKESQRQETVEEPPPAKPKRAPEPAVAQLTPAIVPLPPETAPRQRDASTSGDSGHLDARTVRMTRRQHAAKGVNSPAVGQPSVSPEFRAPVSGKLDLDGGSAPVLSPARHRAAEEVSGLVGSGSTGHTWPSGATRRAGPISRAPDAVRSRMLSLAEGRRRARHARSGEYADPGQSATVGAGRQQWPERGAGTGGKEG